MQNDILSTRIIEFRKIAKYKIDVQKLPFYTRITVIKFKKIY